MKAVLRICCSEVAGCQAHGTAQKITQPPMPPTVRERDDECTRVLASCAQYGAGVAESQRLFIFFLASSMPSSIAAAARPEQTITPAPRDRHS